MEKDKEVGLFKLRVGQWCVKAIIVLILLVIGTGCVDFLFNYLPSVWMDFFDNWDKHIVFICCSLGVALFISILFLIGMSIWMAIYGICVGIMWLWKRFFSRDKPSVVEVAQVTYQLDAPIQTEGEDRLFRSVYVRQLANLITRLPLDEAGYIGLYGKWGEGKTSVCNLLKEYFQKKESGHEALFLEFSPWQYPENANLRSIFFEVMSEALSKDRNSNVGQAFSQLARVFRYQRTNDDVGIVHECVGWLLKIFKILLSQEYLIQCAKQELSKMGKRLIVVVDDLDRLPHEDVCRVIRFLKANGDLPNVVYLILADESYITKALSKMVNGEGREYLEKIIPFTCPLPPIDEKGLKNLLRSDVEQLLHAYELTFPADDEEAYTSVLEYVDSPRKLKRLVNAFRFELAGLKLLVAGRRYLNVHLGDLLVLTVVKIFEPEFFSRLYLTVKRIESIALQTDGFRTKGVSSEWLEECLLNHVAPNHRKWFWSFLKNRLGIDSRKKESRQNDNEQYTRLRMNDARYLREYRLASQYCFPNYFLVTYEALKLQQDEFKEFETKINNHEDVQILLEQFDNGGKLSQLLDILEHQDEFSSSKSSVFFVESLVKLARKELTTIIYPVEEFGYEFSVYTRIFRTILFHVQRLKVSRFNKDVCGTDKVGDTLLYPILSRNNDVILTSYFIKTDSDKHAEGKASYDALFSDKGFIALQESFLINIINLQRGNQLLTHSEFCHLFRVWNLALTQNPSFVHETQTVCSRIIKDKEKLKTVLNLFINVDIDDLYQEFSNDLMNIDRMLLFFSEENVKQIAQDMQNATIFSHEWHERGVALEWALNERQSGRDYSCEAQRDFIRQQRKEDSNA